MGFFQDLKEDLSQAVTELMDEETTKADETVAESVVKEETIKEDVTEIDLEEESSETVVDELLKNMDAAIEKKENKVGEIKKMSEQIVGYSNKDVADEDAIITKGMVVTGDIASRGSMEVIGSIVGNIDILGKLNITGNIQGNSKAAEIFADAAKIVGEIHSEGTVKIGPSSVIIGNITATCAVIAGAVKGDIDVRGPVVLDTSAIVMGNIKSKSVQINNGAVIEGLCSQCYAEVNPTNFFDEFRK